MRGLQHCNAICKYLNSRWDCWVDVAVDNGMGLLVHENVIFRSVSPFQFTFLYDVCQVLVPVHTYKIKRKKSRDTVDSDCTVLACQSRYTCNDGRWQSSIFLLIYIFWFELAITWHLKPTTNLTAGLYTTVVQTIIPAWTAKYNRDCIMCVDY